MTNKQLKKLIKRYTEAREEIIQRILSVKGVGTKTYYNTVLQELNKILKRLSKLSHEALETAIPEKYKQALDELYEQFKKNNLTMLPPNAFAQIHEDAVYDLVREAEYHTDDALSRVGRQVQRYMDTAKDEALRQAGLKASAQKFATASTVTDMKTALEKELKDEGFMTVQYGEGEKAFQVPVETYVAMVARSTTREAGNLARENQLTANGYDLVKMTEHYPTCKVCSALQGRVFSISGKDKRFRPLSDAFRSGYRNVHPNCRHAIGPWIERAYSPEEVEAESRKSLAPLDDARSPAERELYNKQQRQNREARQNYFQWERYRKRLGDDAPKSQLAFERIKKKGGEKWKELQKKYNAAGVDKAGESGIINTNKAKYIDIFNDYDLKPGDPTPIEIMEELSKSSIGREVSELLSELPEGIALKQGNKPDLRGDEHFGKINIYVNQCKNVQWVVRTIIHEFTHYRYGIGDSQWAECVCIAQELKHARNRDYLTIAEKRIIVRAVKGDSDYKKLNWRKGGLINGRRKSHR